MTKIHLMSLFNRIVVWDVKTGAAICGSTAAAPSAGTTFAIAYANHSDEMFVTGGE